VTSAYQVIGPTASGVTLYVLGAVAAGQVPGQLLAANSVAAQQIAAGTITAGQIAAGTITAALIAANTITAAQIQAGTITAAQIQAGTITAAQIQAGSITATQIQAGTILAGAVNGTTITGASFVADGSSGEILVYSSTPASGDLVLSVSATAGTDGHGNAYPAGIGLFNSSSEYTTLSASSAGNLALGTGSAGGGGLEMVSQTGTPNSQYSIFYADANGSAAYRNGPSGYNGQLVNSISQVPTPRTAGSGTPTAVTAAFGIPANDAAPGTVYRLRAWGVGTYSSGSTNWWECEVFGAGQAEALFTGLPSTFLWEAEAEIAIVTAGSSGTAYVKNTVKVSEAPGGGNATPSIVTGMTGGVAGTTIAVNTTTATTASFFCAMTGTASITGITATFERLGP
jgi:hypothetical protein